MFLWCLGPLMHCAFMEYTGSTLCWPTKAPTPSSEVNPQPEGTNEFAASQVHSHPECRARWRIFNLHVALHIHRSKLCTKCGHKLQPFYTVLRRNRPSSRTPGALGSVTTISVLEARHHHGKTRRRLSLQRTMGPHPGAGALEGHDTLRSHDACQQRARLSMF